MEHKRSIFGPLLLIAIGTIWLLVKSGNIPSVNLWALTHVWPFLLIIAGVGMILHSYWKYTSFVLDLVAVVVLVMAIVYAPKLGWANPSMISMIGTSDLFIGPGEPGSGRVIKEIREVSDFHTIEIAYPVQVLIKQGSKESVTIEAEDNLMPNLRTEVSSGNLDIFYKKTGDRHVNPTRMAIITITVKDLNTVDFSSAGELILENLKTDSLDVYLTGAGKMELNNLKVTNLSANLSGAGSMTASGTVDDLDVNISGFGDFNGAHLHGKTANVTISGAGGATVWVDDVLDAEISGAGSVNYYGSPNVNQHINGIGSVNQQGDK